MYYKERTEFGTLSFSSDSIVGDDLLDKLCRSAEINRREPVRPAASHTQTSLHSPHPGRPLMNSLRLPQKSSTCTQILTTHLPLPHPIRKGAQLKARDGIQVQEYFFQDNVSSKSKNDETSSFHCRSISYGEISVRGRDLVLRAFALIFGDGQLSMHLRIDHNSRVYRVRKVMCSHMQSIGRRHVSRDREDAPPRHRPSPSMHPLARSPSSRWQIARSLCSRYASHLILLRDYTPP